MILKVYKIRLQKYKGKKLEFVANVQCQDSKVFQSINLMLAGLNEIDDQGIPNKGRDRSNIAYLKSLLFIFFKKSCDYVYALRF